MLRRSTAWGRTAALGVIAGANHSPVCKPELVPDWLTLMVMAGVTALSRTAAVRPRDMSLPSVLFGKFSEKCLILGDMYQPVTATNDPIFWNHHSFIDLIWENWRLAQQVQLQNLKYCGDKS